MYDARTKQSASFPELHRTTTTLFDAYIACDWSARSTPKSGRDSLWLCRARYAADGTLVWELENPRTRQEATRLLRTWLVAGVEANERTLAGFDFSFGLPEIAYAGLEVTDWRGYWECLHAHIVEGSKNENNRFAVARALNWRAGLPDGGPFWGVPPGAADAHLRATKQPPHDSFPEYRTIETKLRSRKLRPFSMWQLLGNGSVGSQALVGIPVLQSLRTDPVLAPHTRIWPFEREPGSIVIAEVWPSLVDVDLARHEVRDAAQMIALASWAATEDLGGRLAGHLADVEPEARSEGWVLGA